MARIGRKQFTERSEWQLNRSGRMLRRGEVIRLSGHKETMVVISADDCGALVRETAQRMRAFTNGRTGERIEIKSSGNSMRISSRSEVEILHRVLNEERKNGDGSEPKTQGDPRE